MSNETLDTRPRTCAQAIEGMALAFNPGQAGDLEAIIQFHVSPSTAPKAGGEGGGDWYLTIAGGQCRCERGVAAEPTLTITTPADVWLAIARKELSGAKALMTGQYKAQGKMALLLKMDNLFSRPITEADIAARGWREEV
ncbi:MAG: SCP2 sterol-binding domain-containing protein [Anaerolineales bacterium]|nr:SCP2 sterol-binding domain-containing protein [Anaerolineales bacterium]